MTSRARFCISAAHTAEDIEYALAVLKDVVRDTGVNYALSHKMTEGHGVLSKGTTNQCSFLKCIQCFQLILAKKVSTVLSHFVQQALLNKYEYCHLKQCQHSALALSIFLACATISKLKKQQPSRCESLDAALVVLVASMAQLVYIWIWKRS